MSSGILLANITLTYPMSVVRNLLEGSVTILLVLVWWSCMSSCLCCFTFLNSMMLWRINSPARVNMLYFRNNGLQCVLESAPSSALTALFWILNTLWAWADLPHARIPYDIREWNRAWYDCIAVGISMDFAILRIAKIAVDSCFSGCQRAVAKLAATPVHACKMVVVAIALPITSPMLAQLVRYVVSSAYRIMCPCVT